jgi:hypothetical protein
MDAVHKFLLGAVTSLATSGELMSFHVGFATEIQKNLRIFREFLFMLCFPVAVSGRLMPKRPEKSAFFSARALSVDMLPQYLIRGIEKYPVASLVFRSS